MPGTTKTVGAPSFAFFAKGGNRTAGGRRLGLLTPPDPETKSPPKPTFTRTGPASSKR